MKTWVPTFSRTYRFFVFVNFVYDHYESPHVWCEAQVILRASDDAHACSDASLRLYVVCFVGCETLISRHCVFNLTF